MSAHTPGPWEVMPAHRAAPHTVRAIGSALYVATTASDSYRTRDEAEANARLIAAAPDMLAAIKRAAPWVGKMIADGAHRNAVAPQDAVGALQMLEAAIERAEAPAGTNRGHRGHRDCPDPGPARDGRDNPPRRGCPCPEAGMHASAMSGDAGKGCDACGGTGDSA